MSSSECFQNPPAVSSTCGAGSIEEIGGLKSYVTPSSHHHSKLAIIFISDVFGYEAPNLRKLADKVAEAGFLVVVPDFFYGDPYVVNDPKRDATEWLKTHVIEKGFEDAKMVIAALKSSGLCAVGVAGFCWGGMVGVKLASFDDTQAVVLLHPGPISVDEINKVKVPIAILGAEIDHICPAEQIKQLGEILSAKDEVDSFVKIFPGATHGWTTRYNINDEADVKRAEEAHLDVINWFTKFVK